MQRNCSWNKKYYTCTSRLYLRVRNPSDPLQLVVGPKKKILRVNLPSSPEDVSIRHFFFIRRVEEAIRGRPISYKAYIFPVYFLNCIPITLIKLSTDNISLCITFTNYRPKFHISWSIKKSRNDKNFPRKIKKILLSLKILFVVFRSKERTFICYRSLQKDAAMGKRVRRYVFGLGRHATVYLPLQSRSDTATAKQ